MTTETIETLPIGSLEPHPQNRKITKSDCSTLADSIRLHGVIDPLIVRRRNGKYQVVDGHRRLIGCLLAKLPEVPCIVREMNDKEALEMLLVPNIERDNLDPEEEANALKSMLDAGMTEDDLAARLSRSRKWVQLRLNIPHAPKELRAAIKDRRVDMATFAHILAVPAERMQEAVQMVLHPTMQTEPLNAEQARDVLTERIIEPEREREEWEAALPKIIAEIRTWWSGTINPEGIHTETTRGLVPAVGRHLEIARERGATMILRKMGGSTFSAYFMASEVAEAAPEPEATNPLFAELAAEFREWFNSCSAQDIWLDSEILRDCLFGFSHVGPCIVAGVMLADGHGNRPEEELAACDELINHGSAERWQDTWVMAASWAWNQVGITPARLSGGGLSETRKAKIREFLEWAGAENFPKIVKMMEVEP